MPYTEQDSFAGTLSLGQIGSDGFLVGGAATANGFIWDGASHCVQIQISQGQYDAILAESGGTIWASTVQFGNFTGFGGFVEITGPGVYNMEDSIPGTIDLCSGGSVGDELFIMFGESAGDFNTFMTEAAVGVEYCYQMGSDQVSCVEEFYYSPTAFTDSPFNTVVDNDLGSTDLQSILVNDAGVGDIDPPSITGGFLQVNGNNPFNGNDIVLIPWWLSTLTCTQINFTCDFPDSQETYDYAAANLNGFSGWNGVTLISIEMDNGARGGIFLGVSGGNWDVVGFIDGGIGNLFGVDASLDNSFATLDGFSPGSSYGPIDVQIELSPGGTDLLITWDGVTTGVPISGFFGPAANFDYIEIVAATGYNGGASYDTAIRWRDYALNGATFP